MELFKTELYKICTRKLVYIGLLAGMLFFAFYFWTSVLGGEYLFQDGKHYLRGEAIERDKAIAREFAGPLTREKAEKIIARYGWTENADTLKTDPDTGEAKKGYYENSCNTFVTRELSNKRWNDEAPPHLLGQEEAPEITALLDGKLNYGYIGGWGEPFREMQMMLLVVISVLVIISTAPVFSEEYALKTTDVLMTTKLGRRTDARMKVLAALCFATILYLAATGILCGAFAASYGTDAFGVSGELVFPDLFYTGKSVGTTGSVLLRYLGMGLAATWGNVGITLYISSRARYSFISLIWGIVAYLLPYVFYLIIFAMLNTTRMVALLRMITRYFPAFLPMNELVSGPGVYRVGGYFFTLILLVLCILGSCRRYAGFRGE